MANTFARCVSILAKVMIDDGCAMIGAVLYKGYGYIRYLNLIQSLEKRLKTSVA